MYPADLVCIAIALPLVILVYFRRLTDVRDKPVPHENDGRAATPFGNEKVEIARILGRIANLPLTRRSIRVDQGPGFRTDDDMRNVLEHMDEFAHAARQLVDLGPGAIPYLLQVLNDSFARPQAQIAVLWAIDLMPASDKPNSQRSNATSTSRRTKAA